MPELEGFSKRNQGQGRTAGGYVNQAPVRSAPKGPPDKDRCPAGWDTDLWSLTLLFEQYARADRIELRAGRPVIYAELADLVARFEMRGRDTIGSYRQEVHGCRRRTLPDDEAARCWYHHPPQQPGSQEARDLRWPEMVEVIMAEFWSRVQDEHALDQFRQHFREHGKAAADHWRNLRIIKSIDERPTVRPPVMRRQAPDATIADTSKEG